MEKNHVYLNNQIGVISRNKSRQACSGKMVQCTKIYHITCPG